MARRERMSAVDTAWLRMDRPTNLMMIVGVMVFDHRVDFDRLRDTIEARLVARYRRFRQCAVQEFAGAFWQDDPDFSMDAHLHSIADGIALVGVILSLADLTPDAPMHPHVTLEEDETEGDPMPAGLLETLAETLASALNAGTELGGKAFDLASDRDRMSTYGRHGLGLLTELAKLLAMPPDSPTSFKGKTSTVKHVAWCDPFPLAEVKALGKALGCSVNDVLLSAVAGALRAYFEQKGETVREVEVRAMIPVNLRTAKDEGTLGNRFGLGMLSLPLHEGNPFARLFMVRERMNELKSSY